jgi:hypothetical protein
MRQGICAGKIEELMETAGDKAIRFGGGRVEIEGRSYSGPLVLKGGRGPVVAVLTPSRRFSKQKRGLV